MNQRENIAILGFGVEGKAMLTYLLKHGYANITVCDREVDLEEEMPEGVSVKLGKDYLEDLSEFDLIFRSPGIPFLSPQIQLAIENGKKVSSATAFFVEQCVCPIIGVSGTKGKGTTSSLIYQMLKKGSDKDVFLGGNIGNAAIDFLDDLKGDDLVVLEMSSFQLQDLKKSPRYAVFLNTTVDHLDYHEDKEEYLKAKEALLAHQNAGSVAVLNEDYDYFKYYRPLVKGELKTVSRKKEVEDGAYVENAFVFYAKNGKSEKIIAADEVALVGPHNLENVMPAVVIAKELGVSNEDIAEVLKDFPGLPHRLEFVKEVNGVRYYNDSFSTTPETSIAAVESFKEPTILIAGGHDKGLDYGEWARVILTRPSLKTVILIGETARKMEEALVEEEEKLGDAEGSPTKVVARGDLEEAILEAYTEAEEGNVVVMSPAAASFDMFKNYKERGERFRKEVDLLR